MAASPRPRAAFEGTARQLLAQLGADASVSGSELAGRLGLTRAAVWKQVEHLRHAGVAIDAMPGEGYRLRTPVDLLDATSISGALPAAIRERTGPILVCWSTDSTSSELLRTAATDARARRTCLAEIQTAGRGRRGRAWQMPLAGGIALSMREPFEAGMASLAGLSLAAGVAVVDAVRAAGCIDVGLKWPNDIVARGAKLGGILVEVGGDALGPCHAVIGIGLNVHVAAVSAAIDQPCIDVATLGGDTGRSRLAAHLIEHLQRMLARFAIDGFAPYRTAYAALDVLAGREVDVVEASGRRRGIAQGVDARGALRIAFEDGEARLDSADVSIRSAA